jgi:phage terminase large subunit-like protein
MAIDKITNRWIRNEADARAASRGCFFDLERACYTVWWIGRFCRLYEGEWAGEPLILRAAYSQPMKAILDDWDAGGKKKSLAFARDYMDCVDASEPADWQYECNMRLFGWARWSDRWNRNIRRFTRAGFWVPKKNKKSPTLAADTLFLLCGDGEQGAKVFLGAKDGMQIRKNVSLHLFQMVDQSPELNAECKKNMNEMSILHVPTSSILMPLSSSNERTQKSKEGLNGSMFVDETHVVDREFIARVSRMGISRSEPLFAQFSTAGKDTDSYGKEEFDRGRDVNEGRIDDDGYLFAYYGAEQTLSDEQLAADPEGIIAAANPALGHTVDLAEAMADYNRSKHRITDLIDFKSYRLNIWQNAANPWLRMNDWRKCTQKFTESELEGQPCAAGLDLGMVDDMTALSLVFPEDAEKWSEAAVQIDRGEKSEVNVPAGEATRLLTAMEQPVRVVTWYWLPQAAVERYGSEVKYAEWAKAGRLRLVAGEALDPDELLTDIRDILARHNVKMFEYDQWHAALIISALQNDAGFPKEFCFPFQQSIKMFAFPTALMERLVMKGMLHHDGNPITEWQAGHVTVKTDVSGNMRPIKPPRHNRKKIDGIVATIMGLDGATRMNVVASSSIYDKIDHVCFV